MSIKQEKFTKSNLRKIKIDVSKLKKYLPILKVKKVLLQTSINNFLIRLESAKKELISNIDSMKIYSRFFHTDVGDMVIKRALSPTFDTSRKNVAGIVLYTPINISYNSISLTSYPLSHEFALANECAMKFGTSLLRFKMMKALIVKLNKELKKTFIRSSLFENILIPKKESTIKKIAEFLEDQDLLAISQAKVMKKKVEKKKLIEQSNLTNR